MDLCKLLWVIIVTWLSALRIIHLFIYFLVLHSLCHCFITNKGFYYLARSAKVAERAICFTDRNFYLFFLFSFF